MRISITDRCNLRCKYCMPDDLQEISHAEILRYEEILRISEAAIRLGINNFRITGGEPLVRLGCLDFLRALRALPGVGQLMITTNGVLLESHIPALQEIGIAGINISLDTLDREVYRTLTGADALDKVLGGIKAAVAGGLRVKLNCVAMQGVNEEAFLPLTELVVQYPLDLRFIESMPIGSGIGFTPVTGDTLLALLQRHYPGIEESHERRGFGPARYYSHPRLQGQIGIIDAVSHGFCENCNRIRLTSDGFLKTCLYFGEAFDLKQILRQGGDDDALCEAIRKAVENKQEKHFFRQDPAQGEQRKMSQIGG
ncbi:MAG: GTP 3',8-cyclase MoaA [Clostridiales bacterium]|nr:GTP 3',8-cyclase MoaA [Clostridiales bacterium]